METFCITLTRVGNYKAQHQVDEIALLLYTYKIECIVGQEGSHSLNFGVNYKLSIKIIIF